MSGLAEVQRGGMKAEAPGGSPEVELIAPRATHETVIDVLVEVGREGSRSTASKSPEGSGVLRVAVQWTGTADLDATDVRRLEAQQRQHLSQGDASPQLAIVDAGHGTVRP
jgi:hypothetical protein